MTGKEGEGGGVGVVVAIRIKHEQPDRFGMLAIRHSAAWRGYLCTSSGPVRYWNSHNWLHRGEIRIANGVGGRMGEWSQSMWSEWLQYKATKRWVSISPVWAKDNIRLQLRLSFQCDLQVLILKITTYDSKWPQFTTWPETPFHVFM